MPLVLVDVVDDRCALGSDLCEESIRVCLDPLVIAVSPLDLELVYIALFQAWHKYLPYAKGAAQAHLMPSAVPVIEVADHADPQCVWCPYGKEYTRYAV
ncbi:hypothetical protein MBAV_000079 [Candidatus Magnetobacterium bavaricum]|uniref:Uncharacterized protein n=1 Tax=Candidatus Magnetobacterium bavaricum TaxID=29290 RepID=A0A0F3H443_9BACT|nr:hypothetical protein MBAV_000079 [Candidatus Magnetobacterium bavaricum]